MTMAIKFCAQVGDGARYRAHDGATTSGCSTGSVNIPVWHV